MKKAIALLSGGFDSLLAVRIMQKQGFEVIGLNIITPFCDTSAAAREAAEMLGIECRYVRTDDSYLELVRHPRYGYGKGVNPCLDCHLYMIRRAKELMEELGAEIVVTGEVIGQRPMSQQRHHLEMLDYHSGIQGRLIRPICGKLLPPTEAELTGIVDREQLYALSGRARTPLHQLGEELGIEKIKTSMAGCVLTEISFAPRVRDLIKRRGGSMRSSDLVGISGWTARRKWCSAAGNRTVTSFLPSSAIAVPNVPTSCTGSRRATWGRASC